MNYQFLRYPRSLTILLLFVGGLMALPVFPWPSLPGSGLDLTLNQLVWVWVSLATFGMSFYLWRHRLQRGLATTLICAGTALMTLPIAWSPPALYAEALPRLLGLWVLAGLLLLMIQVPVSTGLRRGLYAIVVAGGLLQVLLSSWQVLFPVSAGQWLHYAAYVYGGRPVGGLLQANLLGSFLATALACAVWLMLSVDANAFRRRKWLIALSVILLCAGLAMSRSRSAQAAAILTSFLMIVLCSPQPGRRHPVVVCLLLGVLVGGGALSVPQTMLPAKAGVLPVTTVSTAIDHPSTEIPASSESVEERLARDRHHSNIERMAMLQGVMTLIYQHPFLGNGLATFETEFPIALAQAGIANPFPVTVLHPHNELLYVWCEGGVVGLAGLLFWLVVWLQPFRRCLRSLFKFNAVRKGRYQMAYGLITLPLMAHIMTEFPLYLSALHGVLLVILLRLALPVSATRLRGQTTVLINGRIGLPVLLGTLSLIGGFFAATGVQSAAKLREAEAFSLMDATPLNQVLNPYAQSGRLRFDRAVNDLMQFNQTRDSGWLSHFQTEASRWLAGHNDANLTYSMMQIAAAQQDLLQAQYWRHRGCFSFAQDLRFTCSTNAPLRQAGWSRWNQKNDEP